MHIPDIREKVYVANSLRYQAVIRKWKEGAEVTPEEADRIWWELLSEYEKNRWNSLVIYNRLYMKPSERRPLDTNRFPIDLSFVDSLTQYTVNKKLNNGIELTPKEANKIWWHIWRDYEQHGSKYTVSKSFKDSYTA